MTSKFYRLLPKEEPGSMNTIEITDKATLRAWHQQRVESAHRLADGYRKGYLKWEADRPGRRDAVGRRREKRHRAIALVHHSAVQVLDRLP